MTTTVTVHANHGWPVDVTAITPSGKKRQPIRVKPGETRDFIVHSEQDLLIHEVQPPELAAEKIPALQTF